MVGVTKLPHKATGPCAYKCKVRLGKPWGSLPLSRSEDIQVQWARDGGLPKDEMDKA